MRLSITKQNWRDLSGFFDLAALITKRNWRDLSGFFYLMAPETIMAEKKSKNPDGFFSSAGF